jgi:hypothetical protein
VYKRERDRETERGREGGERGGGERERREREREKGERERERERRERDERRDEGESAENKNFVNAKAGNFNAKQKHIEKVQSFEEVRKLHLNYSNGVVWKSGNSCFEEFHQKCATAERKKNYCLEPRKNSKALSFTKCGQIRLKKLRALMISRIPKKKVKMVEERGSNS